MDTDSTKYRASYRRLATLAVVLSLALMVVSGVGVAQQTATPSTPDGADTNETDANETDANETDANETASVDFNDQESNGTTITVEDVNVPRDGYVAIHNDSLLEGNVVGSVIGVSEYLEAGDYENVTVELYDVPGAEFNESELTENATLIAMPHEETTGNETYDFVSSNGTDDGPYTANGEPVTDDADITVDTETNVTDDNVTTPDDDVTTPDDDVTTPAEEETVAPAEEENVATPEEDG